MNGDALELSQMMTAMERNLTEKIGGGVSNVVARTLTFSQIYMERYG